MLGLQNYRCFFPALSWTPQQWADFLEYRKRSLQRSDSQPLEPGELGEHHSYRFVAKGARPVRMEHHKDGYLEMLISVVLVEYYITVDLQLWLQYLLLAPCTWLVVCHTAPGSPGSGQKGFVLILCFQVILEYHKSILTSEDLAKYCNGPSTFSEIHFLKHHFLFWEGHHISCPLVSLSG